jgi:hypothetical protein
VSIFPGPGRVAWRLIFISQSGPLHVLPTHPAKFESFPHWKGWLKMPEKFPIERDEEFYVYLKSSLPSGYRIEAEPSASYYSEWSYHYSLYEGETLLMTFKGDFRTLEKGTLVREARALLDNLGTGSE